MKGALLAGIIEAIQAHMSWDLDKTCTWLTTINPLFAEMSPLEFFNKRPRKCAKIVNALIEENRTNAVTIAGVGNFVHKSSSPS